MMLSRVDFQDLFPAIFSSPREPEPMPRPKRASAECVARWEDDGGLHLSPPPRWVRPEARTAMKTAQQQ